MKPAESKGIIQNVKKSGYLFDGTTYWPPDSVRGIELASEQSSKSGKKKKRTKPIKTGWIDDTRNIANKLKQLDMFMRLVKIELGIELWPEFFFSIEREYRFDYAIPVGTNLCLLKIAIEVEGGIWSKGNSGHSSGTGITRDMDKSTLANLNGWTLIRCTPTDIKKEPGKIIQLIRQAIELKK